MWNWNCNISTRYREEHLKGNKIKLKDRNKILIRTFNMYWILSRQTWHNPKGSINYYGAMKSSAIGYCKKRYWYEDGYTSTICTNCRLSSHTNLIGYQVAGTEAYVPTRLIIPTGFHFSPKGQGHLSMLGKYPLPNLMLSL